MILTVTLNAAVDKTYRIDDFTIDRVHRPTEWKVVAGGKGINVARVYRTLGGQAVATGFLGGETGAFVEHALAKEGMDARFVPTAEPSRECIAVVDPVCGTQTEVNEVGPNVGPQEVTALRQRVEQLLQQEAFDFLVLSGSTPPGTPHGIYADLIETGRRAGVRCVLDASGEPLRLGVAARPWMVKPNIHELSALVGAQPAQDSDIIEAARKLRQSVLEVVCVTRGSDSVFCVSGDGAWQAAPPRVDFVSAVGSGDAFLGAFLRAAELGEPLPVCLAWACGAGSANAAEYGAGFCSKEEIARLAGDTVVTTV